MGFLAGTKPAAVAARVAAFQQGLREMGYVEGKNIVVDHRTQKETGSRA
jgi:Fe2+ transport system protein FeoA